MIRVMFRVRSFSVFLDLECLLSVVTICLFVILRRSLMDKNKLNTFYTYPCLLGLSLKILRIMNKMKEAANVPEYLFQYRYIHGTVIKVNQGIYNLCLHISNSPSL